MSGQPKPAFYFVLFLVVAGLVGFAAHRSGLLAPEKKPDDQHDAIDPTSLGLGKGPAESPDSNNVTTVKEYTYVAAEKLPPVKGSAAYKPLKDNTVVFALNVWAGWAPIIHANNGMKPGKVWTTPDGKEFKVELRLIDDPVEMINSYTTGDVHIGWGTLDMVPLFVNSFWDPTKNEIRDSRIMPRIFQQVDWSNGGDGIVARESIKTVADLRGKRVVLAQNSPSHYFLLNMLVAAGLQPSEVKMDFTKTAFEAAVAFNSDQKIAAAVSWAPDIYNLAKVRGNKMLVNTLTANKLIADVWFARADFAKDHPGICEALVRGIFDAMEALKAEPAKLHVAQLMKDGFDIKAEDAYSMLADAHSTNWAENYQFFLNQNNPTNFAQVWDQAYYLYRQIRVITYPKVAFDQVMDFSVIKKLGNEPKYSSQKDDYTVQFVPKATSEIRIAEDEILTNTVVINFFPNSADLEKMVTKEQDGKTIQTVYDPKAKLVIAEIGKLAGQFGNARIIIEGHTDGSMKNKAPYELVKELSLNRANAVKQAVVKQFKMDSNKFNVVGMAWDHPADRSDPENHAKNRRVEVKIYTAEQQ